jgi:hypothetical protein
VPTSLLIVPGLQTIQFLFDFRFTTFRAAKKRLPLRQTDLVAIATPASVKKAVTCSR